MQDSQFIPNEELSFWDTSFECFIKSQFKFGHWIKSIDRRLDLEN